MPTLGRTSFTSCSGIPKLSDPDAISVAAQDGAVTLSGHAPTCVEKLAAVRAVERVYGVRAVADETKGERSLGRTSRVEDVRACGLAPVCC
jgi:hypothetical protein